MILFRLLSILNEVELTASMRTPFHTWLVALTIPCWRTIAPLSMETTALLVTAVYWRSATVTGILEAMLTVPDSRVAMMSESIVNKSTRSSESEALVYV